MKTTDDYNWNDYTKEYSHQMLSEVSRIWDVLIKKFEINNNVINFYDNLHDNWKEIYHQVVLNNVKSVFECGCGLGHHIRNISTIKSEIEISGCDIAQSQIDFGKSFINFDEKKYNIAITDFSKKNAFMQFNRQYEFVFTQAVTMHLSYDKAKVFVENMIKLSSKYVLLVESNAHDYEALVAEVLKTNNIIAKVTKTNKYIQHGILIEKYMMPTLKQDTKLLVMCSSRERSHRIGKMIDSFNKTKRGNTELVVYIAEDDPDLEKYKSLLANVKYIIGPHKHLVQVDNYLSCEVYPNIEYYAEVNDDHVYVTEGWDIIFMDTLKKKNNWGCVYGATKNILSAVMISGKTVRTLGYFAPPVFTQYFSDYALMDLFKPTNLLIHVPEVLINHEHYAFGLAPMDKTYQAALDFQHSNQMNGAAQRKIWEAQHRDADINKLKAAIEAGK